RGGRPGARTAAPAGCVEPSLGMVRTRRRLAFNRPGARLRRALLPAGGSGGDAQPDWRRRRQPGDRPAACVDRADAADAEARSAPVPLARLPAVTTAHGSR